MTWEIEKTYTFDAAHQLPNHDGKCARLHGHTYQVTVRARTTKLEPEGPKTGMAGGLDYHDLDKLMQPLLETKLDHHFLNETLGFYTTTENVARWLYHELALKLPPCVSLGPLTIREGARTACTYQS